MHKQTVDGIKGEQISIRKIRRLSIMGLILENYRISKIAAQLRKLVQRSISR